jgi:hypothetical protein
MGDGTVYTVRANRASANPRIAGKGMSDDR